MSGGGDTAPPSAAAAGASAAPAAPTSTSSSGSSSTLAALFALTPRRGGARWAPAAARLEAWAAGVVLTSYRNKQLLLVEWYCRMVPGSTAAHAEAALGLWERGALLGVADALWADFLQARGRCRCCCYRCCLLPRALECCEALVPVACLRLPRLAPYPPPASTATLPTTHTLTKSCPPTHPPTHPPLRPPGH